MKLSAAAPLSLFLFLLFPLLLGPAVAQDLPVAEPAEVAGADALLAGLVGFDEGVCGETELAVLVSGGSIGGGKLVVEKAADGSGGIYRIAIELELAMGAMKMSIREVAILDEKFALVSSESRRVADQGAGQEIEEKKITRADGKWTRVKTEGEESTTLVFASDGLNHGSMLSSILLARKLAGSPSGEYVFTGIDWGDQDGEPKREPKSQALTMTVKDAKPATFAGKELEVRQIQGAKQGDPEKTDFVVGTDGRLVSFAPSVTPLVFMAADLAGEATAPEEVKPGTDSPLAAVVLYLKVFTGAVPVTELNKVMDWEAIHKEMSAADPNIAALDVDALRKILLAEFGKQVGAATAEQVDMLIPMLTVKEDADKAAVTMPGRTESPFLLRKTATGWLITRFPR